MRVFLSWSGEVSHKVACVLKDWLPSVIQSIRPYVSSQDIDKGARWSTDIAKELHESTFGILCVTRSNIEAPWINFEAGALSKTIDKAMVAPFLFDIKRSEVQGPLLQFQSTVNERADVLKLISSLNSAMPAIEKLEEIALKKSFDVWWPELEKELKSITPVEERLKPVERSGKLAHSEAILEEILDLARSQQRLMRSPEELFPRPYFEYLLRDYQRDQVRIDDAMRVTNVMLNEVSEHIQKIENLTSLEPTAFIEGSHALLDNLRTILKNATYMLTDSDRNIRIRRPINSLRRATRPEPQRKEDEA